MYVRLTKCRCAYRTPLLVQIRWIENEIWHNKIGAGKKNERCIRLTNETFCWFLGVSCKWQNLVSERNLQGVIRQIQSDKVITHSHWKIYQFHTTNYKECLMITSEWPAQGATKTASADSEGPGWILASSFDHDKLLKSRTFNQRRVPLLWCVPLSRSIPKVTS